MRRLLIAIAAVLALPAPASAAPSIVGGGETTRDWSFMAYIDKPARQELELGDAQYCGGSLIAPTWVMTAAHCVDLEALDPLVTTVVLGRHDRSDTSSGERIQARRIIVHESYDTPVSANDVALIELERPAAQKPVQVAGEGEEGLWGARTMSTVLGWGATSEGGAGSDVLKEAQVPIITDADCERTEADFDATTMVCAAYLDEGGTDTCQGDSGGPLLVPAPDGGWRQAGITSFGEGCARPGKPGVYTRIAGAKLRSWLAAKVPEAVAPPVAAAAPQPPAPTEPPPASPAAPPPPAPAGPAQPASPPAAKPAARKKPSCRTKARRIKSAKKRRAALKRCARAQKKKRR